MNKIVERKKTRFGYIIIRKTQSYSFNVEMKLSWRKKCVVIGSLPSFIEAKTFALGLYHGVGLALNVDELTL